MARQDQVPDVCARPARPAVGADPGLAPPLPFTHLAAPSAAADVPGACEALSLQPDAAAGLWVRARERSRRRVPRVHAPPGAADLLHVPRGRRHGGQAHRSRGARGDCHARGPARAAEGVRGVGPPHVPRRRRDGCARAGACEVHPLHGPRASAHEPPAARRDHAGHARRLARRARLPRRAPVPTLPPPPEQGGAAPGRRAADNPQPLRLTGRGRGAQGPRCACGWAL